MLKIIKLYFNSLNTELKNIEIVNYKHIDRYLNFNHIIRVNTMYKNYYIEKKFDSVSNKFYYRFFGSDLRINKFFKNIDDLFIELKEQDNYLYFRRIEQTKYKTSQEIRDNNKYKC